ncbi:MAG TPA: hypothetical protein VD772_09115 [Anseongella sp.]|nr:hypothetical protein [Anseongella sp.]
MTIGLCNCRQDDGDNLRPGGSELNDRRVGASAREILSAADYQSVEVEIQYMPGYEPEEATVNNLRNFLNELINKPAGMQIHVNEIPASAKERLSAEEIEKIEEEYRTVYTEGPKLGIYLAYKNTSMALFGKTIHDNTGGLAKPSRVKLETTVMEHEFGHIMGLVHTGSPMQSNHQDPEHGSHCNNGECLMYYASETTAVLDFLVSSPVPGLDAACRNDLKANGGK